MQPSSQDHQDVTHTYGLAHAQHAHRRSLLCLARAAAPTVDSNLCWRTRIDRVGAHRLTVLVHSVWTPRSKRLFCKQVIQHSDEGHAAGRLVLRAPAAAPRLGSLCSDQAHAALQPGWTTTRWWNRGSASQWTTPLCSRGWSRAPRMMPSSCKVRATQPQLCCRWPLMPFFRCGWPCAGGGLPCSST